MGFTTLIPLCDGGSGAEEVMNSAAAVRCHSECSEESLITTVYCEKRDSPLRSECHLNITSSIPLP